MAAARIIVGMAGTLQEDDVPLIPSGRRAVVIPERGNYRLTEQLVRHIRQFNGGANLIIVNDWDRPRPTLAGSWILENAEAGVTAAWNLGIQFASTRLGADMIVLLNNDVLCRGPFLDRLTGIPGGQIAGTEWRTDRATNRRVLTGWCLAFHVDDWARLGGFDAKMKLYFSDTDFLLRAEDAGIAQVVKESLPLRHLGHKTAHNRQLQPERREVWRADRNVFLQKARNTCWISVADA